MKLEKWPETEMKYWMTIEGIGSFIWSTRHDFSHGRIFETPEIFKELKEAREIQEQLVSEIFVLFGVVHPKDCPQGRCASEIPPAPLGMVWYWQWYEKMKTEYYSEQYKGMICSVCPFSRGLQEFIDSGSIPCNVFKGVLYRLIYPHICGMKDIWGQKKLYREIKEEAGPEVLAVFKKAEKELKNME